MIFRACVTCGTPSPDNYCSRHKPKPWAGSDRARRLPSNWPVLRAMVLGRDPICRVCNHAPSLEVDHIQHGDDHSLANLQGICSPCHRTKSGREGQASR
jgi:5-methylcytosine-specific restriction endonuclease McrA